MEYFDPKSVIPEKLLNGENKDFFRLIASDLKGKIPKDIADRILQENNDPNYTILIHRTAYETAQNIFENGLEIRGGNNLDYTTSRYDSDLTMMISLNGASGYKNHEGRDSRVIVMKIPNSALEYEPGKTKPILYQTDNIAEQGGGMVVVKGKYQTVLLPEYILGSIEYKKGRITEFVENELYTDEHTYENNGLVCPDETLYSYIKYYNMNGKLEQLENIANDNIISENNEYMKNPEKFQTPKRNAESLKKFSLRDLTKSKFTKIVQGFKRFFTQDKENRDDQSR